MGSRDNSFQSGLGPGWRFSLRECVAVQASGKILVGGNFTNSRRHKLYALASNGNLDTAFTANADDSVYAAVIRRMGAW